MKELSPIEKYMINRAEAIKEINDQNKKLYTQIIIDGIVTDYGVNKDGDVFSYKTGKLLNPHISPTGKHVTICYTKNGQRLSKNKYVAHLVANAYMFNPDNCKYIGYEDGNIQNTNVDNLYWTNEKDISTMGYDIDELKNIFDTIKKGINKQDIEIASDLGVRDWIIIRFRSIIRHIKDHRLPMTSETITIGFRNIMCNGVKNTRYHINPFGIIKNINTGRFILGTLSKHGYPVFTFKHDGELSKYRIHRLVAESFIDNPQNLPEVHHRNSNTLDPCVWNLEWITHKGNMGEARMLGEMKRGEDRKHKYTNEDIAKVCQLIDSKQYSISDISKMTGVPREIVRDIRSGKRWQHVSQNFEMPYIIFGPHGKFIGEDGELTKRTRNRINNSMNKSIYGKYFAS